MNRPIVLASASPRRKELLAKIEPEFEVLPSNLEESVPKGMLPMQIALHLANQKAVEVLQKRPNSIVIGADTIVVLGKKVLGKPSSENEAREMLCRLSGKMHEVITGVCVLAASGKESFAKSTRVTFRALSDSEIFSYVATGEPMDKAGAYAIQGGAADFVESIQGDYDNVMGLPITRLAESLARAKG